MRTLFLSQCLIFLFVFLHFCSAAHIYLVLVGWEIIKTFPSLLPHVRLQGAVGAGDGGAAGETRHPVARHGERVLGVGRHGGE